jgi:hypothetical protein
MFLLLLLLPLFLLLLSLGYEGKERWRALPRIDIGEYPKSGTG